MEKLHNAVSEFILRGFTPAPYKGRNNSWEFRKSHHGKLGTFAISFVVDQDSFHQKPVTRILNLPDELKDKRLPHLIGTYVCLYNSSENVDPTNIKSLVAGWVVKLEQIIAGWESDENSDDIVNEWDAYWDACFTVYLLDSLPTREKPIEMNLFTFNRKDILTDKEVTEEVVASSANLVNKWAISRSCISPIQQRRPCIWVYLPFTPKVVHTRTWPPKDAKSLFYWLNDEPDSHRVFQQIFSRIHKLKGRKYNLIFDYNGHQFGCVFEIDQHFKSTLSRFYSSTRKGRVGVESLMTSFFGLVTRRIRNIYRFKVSNASPEFILQRNSFNDSILLKDKRIVLIGCGTIGGYLAGALVQLGAGHGRGQLDIYDSDVLNPGNLSRHTLGVQYLGNNKALSMAADLRAKHPFFDISGHEYNFNPVEERLSGPDIIINTTGHEPLSMLLSERYRSLGIGKVPVIIHGWISGFGHGVKVFREALTLGCYACQYDYRHVDGRKERFPTLSGDPAQHPYKRSCGELHLPFASDASHAAVSLILQMLQTESKKTNLMMRSLTASAISLKNKTLIAQSGCPICKR